MVAEQREFLLADLDGASTILGNQHPVTGLHAGLNDLSILSARARANSQHTALRQLLNSALGEEDAAGGLGLGLDALDKNAVEEGSEGLDGLEGGGLGGC